MPQLSSLRLSGVACKTSKKMKVHMEVKERDEGCGYGVAKARRFVLYFYSFFKERHEYCVIFFCLVFFNANIMFNGLDNDRWTLPKWAKNIQL